MITQAQNVPNLKTSGYAILTAFSKKWNARYWQTAVLPAITNSVGFSELQKGDQVNIPREPLVTFKTYANGQELDPERLDIEGTQLLIDQAGYFCVPVTDVDAELSHLDLANKFLEGGQKAGQKFIDLWFFDAMKAVATADNRGDGNGKAGKLSKMYDVGLVGAGYGVNTSNVVKFVTGLEAVGREQVAADVGVNSCVIPVWLWHVMLNSELKNAIQMGDTKSMLRTGAIGRLGNTDFYVNTYLSGTGNAAATPSQILWCNKEAISYTLRMTKAEKYRTKDMETLIQGMLVWGAKCIKPEGVVNAWAYRASDS